MKGTLRFLLGVFVCVLGCTRAEPAHKRVNDNRLVVLIAVNGLRGDEIERYWPLWRYGFRRFLEDGHYYSEAVYRHGNTGLATGSATLSTGVSPRLHGIVGNEIFLEDESRTVRVCEGDQAPCGANALLVPTLVDRLKSRSPDSKVLVLSQEKLSARLLGGASADALLWFDKSEFKLAGELASRSEEEFLAYQRYFESIAGLDRISRIWELPRIPRPFSDRLDGRIGEWDNGHGVTFPHYLDESDPQKLRQLWGRTPDSDRALGDLAAFLLRKLEMGRDSTVDYCVLSFSAVDHVGHDYGPHSVERIAVLMELDRTLGDLLEVIEKQTEARALIALTSSSGIGPTVAEARDKKKNGARISEGELLSYLNEALKLRFADHNYIKSITFPFVYLDVDGSRQRKEVTLAVTTLLSEHPAVYRAWAVDSLGTDPDPVAQAIYETHHQHRSGDIAFVLRPYQAIESSLRGEFGAESGSPWYYDRHVPVMVLGHKVAEGRTGTKVSVIDLVRTLGDELELRVDVEGGNPLSQAIAY